ncbi:MAG: DUF3368 domain-containing protein [Gammaproteobacteria bacterium]|nr:DUF3368 domain-containing protein [Gammaproteobacteria bacterium]MYK30130.1 DUF3368 domain-containing protein [Gammaproteobacteria bacterium]
MNHGMGSPAGEPVKDVSRVDRPFVADAGPLIALGRIGRLHLLRELFGLGLIPPAVHAEVAVGSGRAGAAAVGQVLEAGWLRVVRLEEGTQATRFARLVDAGEAEAIALCLSRAVRFLLIDDAKGRKVAQSAGIPVMGVAGVLLAAKTAGHLPAVSLVIEDLVGVGYRLSRSLVEAVQRRANE